jgi:hypothetical protein
MKERDDELRRYRAEILALREENELLRRSARAFGALAERLHLSLQEERRRSAERRTQARLTPDRRQSETLSSGGLQNCRQKR